MNKYILILILGVLAFNYSCTDDFEELNTPSNVVTEPNAAYLFSNTVQSVFANYQRNWNLYADMYGQYMANTRTSFPSPRYEYRNDWVGNFWRESYTQHLRKTKAIQDLYGDNPAYTNAIAQKEIWECYWWSRLTDYYGDIPYFGAAEGKTVTYNSQQEVYYDLLARITKAVNDLNEDNTQFNYGEYDLIFRGNVSKWKRFGNSLRMRLAMRMSNVDPSKAKEEFVAAFNDGGMTTNDDVAQVPMWKDGWYDYLHQMGWNWDRNVISKTMADRFYDQSTAGEDPRAEQWLAYQVTENGVKVAKSKEEVGKDKYFGLENGRQESVPAGVHQNYARLNLSGSYVGFSGNGGEVSMYCPVMFYSETLFLNAEAALRGWISGEPNTLYKQAVLASMDFVGVEQAKANAWVDGLLNLEGSNEAKLKQLITQKWVSNFPNGVEAWADFRRTDYPDFTLPYDGISGNATVSEGTYVKRIRYPDNQHQVNELSMPESLNTLDKDRMDVRLWWDVADTKTKTNGLMSSNF
ncbi:SusD/RagB family nutrient-binding outer membrane lipoprotein [uncultured Draconibacterium sp.]|uniref:SusD/RagB family nutrient-binding outer membrane lipoprotein n=1 Tax=uncultured Draconibacterium sp. TaxID=1573823 RepID=UPI0029C08BEC|nr:SusD/RagB family nutrient-binding outer membrane lipoprotein [uncultured Draconibacterium sp.]